MHVARARTQPIVFLQCQFCLFLLFLEYIEINTLGNNMVVKDITLDGERPCCVCHARVAVVPR